RYGRHPVLHSFPTRRSSDLKGSDRLQNSFLPIFPWSSRRAFDFLLPNNTACQPMERFVLCQNCIQPGFGIWFTLERFLFQLLFEDRKSTRLNSSHVKISYAV